ncbi:MAG: flagellar hook-length control protein FliK [Alphaproteobacteria bacterium]|nr:flagellar hook-length control protein FliK [Alphaproteobacteria bacterium]
MEIQDRNNLLQLLYGAKDNKVQVAFEGNSFVDVLKSTQSEASTSKDEAGYFALRENVEVKSSVKDVKRAEKQVLQNKKQSPVKQEVKENNVSKDKKNEVNEEDAVGASQSDINDEVVDKSSQQNTDESMEQTQGVAKTESENKVEGESLGDDIQQNVSEDVLQDVFADVLLKEGVVSSEGLMLVSETADEFVEVEKVKQDIAQVQKISEEALVPVSEEEAVIMEQEKYFDEKIISNKKVKIEVSVSEEKIADPIVKDVLKNRFEIDSLFQSVENEAETILTDSEVLPVNADMNDETNIMPELKNSIYGDVKVVQEASKPAVISDSSVVAVSGKEVVAEVVNVSRNEAFAKINEATSRDNFKGIAKEVVEQIKVNITKSAVKGVDTIDIQLKPEDLGKIQIKMHIAKDGKVQAEIIASRAETADMLQKDASSLSKAFNDAGYDTDAKSFTSSFQNENQAKGQEKDDSGLLKFIGDTLEQEAENIAGNDNVGYDPVLGLNIRV